MSSIACERRDDGVVVLTLDAPDAAVNTMDAAFKAELASVVDRLVADRLGLRGVVVRSAKSSFFAGGNLREISGVRPDQGAAFFEGLQRMKAALRRFETLGVPTVALLNGHALGGGFELALSCHHRIAVDDDRIQFGCPEATLGLLPGAGGVAKLVRMLGVERALPYLLEGRRISPRDAAALGLVDELVSTSDALMDAAFAWLARDPHAVQPWDRDAGTGVSTPCQPVSPSEPTRFRDQVHASAEVADDAEELTATQAIRRAAEEGAQADFETALLLESRYLTRLVTGRYARNMIGTLFFQMNELRSGAGRPHDAPRHPIALIGFVASDASVLSLTMRCVERGIGCRIYVEDEETNRALEARVSSESAMPSRAGASSGGERPTAAVTVVPEPGSLAGCDLIIDARVHPNGTAASLPAWLAAPATTSTLSDQTIVGTTARHVPVAHLTHNIANPERLVGLVFAEAVGKAPLVEIVRGARTGPVAVARAFDLVLRIGGLPIIVNDSPGRLVSRVANGFLIEAMALLGEGVAATTVEEAALRAGMSMGPLAMLDEGAFEAIDSDHHAHEHQGHEHHAHEHHAHEHHAHEHHAHEHHAHEHHAHEHHAHEHHAHEHHAHEHHAHEHHGHEHHAHEHHGHEHHAHEHHAHHAHHDHDDCTTEAATRKAPLPESAVYVLEKMAHGFHRSGRRKGGGFYDYADDGSRALWPGLSAFARKSRRTPSAEEACDRLLYIQAIETLRCLQEGVITTTRDANIGSIFGWGFPERTGGAAQFVNHVGITRFVERSRELAQRYGARFEPPALVVRLADTDQSL